MLAAINEPPIVWSAIAPPWWDDRAVFLIGGGSSLTGFDLGRLRGRGYTVGINHSMLALPVDVGVSIDHRFMRERRAALEAFAAATPLYLPMRELWWRLVEPIAGALYVRDEPEPGLSLEPDRIRRACTSGYAALNLATLKRARRIVLLGYDYGVIAGRHHYHDAYPWHVPGDQNWAGWARSYEAAAKACTAAGVEVVNASPASAIAAFPKLSIEDALRWAGTPC